MNVILYLITIVCLYLLAVVFTIFIALYVAKVRRQKYSEKKIGIMRKYQKGIDLLLESGLPPSEIVPKTMLEQEVLEEEFARRLKNEHLLLKNIQPFIRKHFLASYRKRLKHSRPEVRMKSMVYIGLFHLTELEKEINSLLNRKEISKQEKYQVYFTLASLSSRQVLEMLQSGEGELPLFVRRGIMEIFLAESDASPVIREFYLYPLEIQECILDVLQNMHVRNEEYLNLLEELIQDEVIMSQAEYLELRIRIWKGVASFGYFPKTSLILDSVPCAKAVPERIMLARSMGSIRSKEFLPYLETMLGDSSYLVRNESAKSIIKYPEGMKSLNRIAAYHPDRFARDIAGEWLERSHKDA
ncbi:HEAT repeat domain-containing protein [Mesobacillus campisalis]|uniref:HEAT repeat domain-containing protein n=1 Tax=Mesobacillus campisalis TaxID=1408103 RepID=UPI00069B7C2C|nr:HEAT repeat domain-containing protein [Mesobacillus campisalis]